MEIAYRSFRIEGEEKRARGCSQQHGKISPRVSAQDLVGEICIDAARLPRGLGGCFGFPEQLASARQHRV